MIQCDYCEEPATIDRCRDNGHGGGSVSSYACAECNRRWPR